MEHLKPLRLSLVAVWLITGVVSLIELNGQSADLLKSAGLSDAFWIHTLIWAGAGLDLLLGLALLCAPSRNIYLVTLASMGLMTVIATLLSPSLWLHPLGPLLKNIPIAAMLYSLIRAEKS
jgi:hypothetical protein